MEDKFEKISERAYKKLGFEDDYDVIDKYAYIMLKELYKKFNERKITKEDSVAKKKKIKLEYEQNKEEYNRVVKIYADYNEKHRKNYELMTKMEKSSSKDEIFYDALQVISNCMLDSTFKDRIIDKLENK